MIMSTTGASVFVDSLPFLAYSPTSYSSSIRSSLSLKGKRGRGHELGGRRADRSARVAGRNKLMTCDVACRTLTWSGEWTKCSRFGAPLRVDVAERQGQTIARSGMRSRTLERQRPSFCAFAVILGGAIGQIFAMRSRQSPV
jgi:hypothetical protein